MIQAYDENSNLSRSHKIHVIPDAVKSDIQKIQLI